MIHKMTYFLVLGIFLTSTTLLAQPVASTDVPEIVDLYVKFHFPHLKDTKTYKIDYEKVDGNFKASFLVNDEPAYIILTPDGELIKKAYQIPLWGIPPAVEKQIKKRFHDYSIYSLFKISSDNKQEYIYQVSYRVPFLLTSEGEQVSIKKEEMDSVKTTAINQKNLPLPVTKSLSEMFSDYQPEKIYLIDLQKPEPRKLFQMTCNVTEFYTKDGKPARSVKEPVTGTAKKPDEK